MFLRVVLLIFQFHKGTIRTTHNMSFDSNTTNFNSIKVRLERANYLLVFGATKNFNSIKVRLEPKGRLMFAFVCGISIP